MKKYRSLHENSTDVIKWNTRKSPNNKTTKRVYKRRFVEFNFQITHFIGQWTEETEIDYPWDNSNYKDYQSTIEWVETPPVPSISKDRLALMKALPNLHYPPDFGRVKPFRIEHMQYPITSNDDIPHDPQLEEMGCDETPNPFLSHSLGDPRSMNEAHFTDLCLKYGSKLVTMFEKRQPDFDPMVFNRPEELMELLECTYEDAHTIAHCLKRLEFNKSLARRVIFGYTTSEGTCRRGLKGIGASSSEAYAEMLSDLVEKLPELPPTGENMVSLDASYEDITDNPWSKLSVLLEEQPDPDTTIYINLEDPDELPGYVDAFGDEEPIVLGDDGIGTFSMWDGTESLDHEYVERVRRADVETIWEIQQEFYPQKVRGRWMPAQNAWMTPQQVSFAWQFINDRKSQLLELAIDQATEQTNEVIRFLKELKPQQRKPLVLSYINGRSFNNKGRILEFKQRPSKLDQFLLWSELRKSA